MINFEDPNWREVYKDVSFRTKHGSEAYTIKQVVGYNTNTITISNCFEDGTWVYLDPSYVYCLKDIVIATRKPGSPIIVLDEVLVKYLDFLKSLKYLHIIQIYKNDIGRPGREFVGNMTLKELLYDL